MTGKISISLLNERQDGHIGDDWKYAVLVMVFNDGLVDEGSIDVPEHQLLPGTDQAPPGPADPLVLNAGAAGSDILVRVRLDATEVDTLIDDHGTSSEDFAIRCPHPGEPPVSEDAIISAGVMESPVIEGESAILRLTLRLRAES